MKPITLNLASRPFRNNIVVGTVVGVTATALVLATVYNLYLFLSYGSSYAQLQHDQAEDRVHIAELQKEEQRLAGEIKKRDFRHTYERGKIAHDLILKHSFSWTRLFNTLEGVVPPDVVMTAIRPNVAADGIVVRIEGVAKSHGALLNLETQLQGNAAFARVYPLNERRLNPSLPDITFLVTFNYLPHRTPASDLVAAGNPGDAAPPPAPAVETGAAPDAGAASATGGKSVETAGGTSAKTPPSTAEPASPTVLAAGVRVGRDGLPWERRGASGPVIAPGGIESSSATVAKPITPKKGKGSKPSAPGPEAGKKEKAEHPPAPATNSVTAASQPGANAAAAKLTPARPAPAKSTTTIAAPAISGPALPAPSPAATPPARAIPGPPRFDPNARHPRPQGPGTPLQAQAVAQAQANRPPAAAQRLDVPLSFVSRPVAEVYQRLAEAHGVRFELDEAVDREARITVNLKGRNLEDAIVLVSGMSHQQVRRLADGVYRVVPLDAAQPLADPPVDEESIPPQEEP